MAVYKVPLDIEAEDKLIGPFSFKQFIFLLVGALFSFFTYLAAQVSIVLVIIPFPFAAIFLLLGGIQRKDQPVDVYLMALAKFYFKPRKRLWSPEGHVERVKITVPKVEHHVYTDSLSRNEIRNRLDSLAQNLDTRGWASKNVSPQQMGSMIMGQQAPSDRLVQTAPQQDNRFNIDLDIRASDDVLETNNSDLAHQFDQRIAETAQRTRQAAIDAMRNPHPEPQPQPVQPAPAQPATAPTPAQQPMQTQSEETNQPTPQYNPYGNMHQKVIRPIGEEPEPQPQPESAPAPQKPAMTEAPSTDILNLSQNSDLDIATIARQAEKKQQEQSLENDQEISLH